MYVFLCLFTEYYPEVLRVSSTIEGGGSAESINVWFLDKDHIKVGNSVVLKEADSGRW
jgi:hypothetical protein